MVLPEQFFPFQALRTSDHFSVHVGDIGDSPAGDCVHWRAPQPNKAASFFYQKKT